MSEESKEMKIYLGSAVRMSEAGEVAGYLVRHTSPAETDTYGDYFSAETDHDIPPGEIKSTPIYFHHRDFFKVGQDRVERVRSKVGDAKMGVDERGVWIQGVLDERHEYYERIKQLVREGALGWSSGTAQHLIDYEEVKGANHITKWPLGLDATLTHMPADFRNRAVSLKAFPTLALTESVRSAESATTQQETEKMSENTEQAALTAQDLKDALKSALDPFAGKIDALEARLEKAEKNADENFLQIAEYGVPQNVKMNKLKLGDPDPIKSYCSWIRGQISYPMHMRNMRAAGQKASNATDMNITTAADGGNAVPTGHYQGIIARRDESSLVGKLGLMRIPGKGTTVNVPVDNEDDGEFVSTAEAGTFDLDAPALDQVQSTLVKYTKRVLLSDELLEDEDSALIAFLNNFIGRGAAKTYNSLIVAEAVANGTNLLTFASATAIAAGEPEQIVDNDNLGAYMDDAGSVSWLMRWSTHWMIKRITGDDRMYDSSKDDGKTLLDMPVNYSNKVATVATGNASVLFGNWSYMGYRDQPMTVLRNPFKHADTGQLALYYYLRTDLNVLQAEAIGYADQA